MYSVIIQNQNLMKKFRDYYPLFVELFQNEDVGCCTWVESGEDIATSLPGLTELIEGKKEWRAVIVRDMNDEVNGCFECNSANPYDFSLNSRENILERYPVSEDNDIHVPVEESPIPIIRLSQMLGGVPSPELFFESNIDKGDKTRPPKDVFVSRGSEEDEKKYEELVRKYDFDGKTPCEVIFITLKNAEPKSIREDVKAKWSIRKETEETTDFCRRNRYSSCSRFLVYEYFSEGRIQREADLFNFWCSVMLMAREDISPSALQAYRLYRVKTSFDLTAMKECFREKADELYGCRNFVEKEIKREIEKRLNDKQPIPPYRMTLSVSPELPAHIDVMVNHHAFKFCPKSVNDDLVKWKAARTGSEKNLSKVYISSEKALDDSSAVVRHCSRYDDSQVYALDKYDRRLMEEELSETFDKIIQMQTKISSIKNKTDERTEKASASVVESIKKRIDIPTAVELGLCLLAGIVLAVIPGLIFKIKYHYGGFKGVLFNLLFMIFFFVATEMLLLLWKKISLRRQIHAFNDAMKDNMDDLSDNMDRFSEFVSNIVSHSRGKNYLQQLEDRKYDSSSTIPDLQLHLNSINKTLERLKKWAEGFGISISDEYSSDREYALNYNILPENNSLYTFETGEDHKIPLNNEGDHINSPFRFINGLSLRREELFKDA